MPTTTTTILEEHETSAVHTACRTLNLRALKRALQRGGPGAAKRQKRVDDIIMTPLATAIIVSGLRKPAPSPKLVITFLKCLIKAGADPVRVDDVGTNSLVFLTD